MQGRIKDPRVYFQVRTSWPSMVYVARSIKRQSATKRHVNSASAKGHAGMSQGGGNGCIR